MANTGEQAWIARNRPEWWVVNERGHTVCLDSQPLFNLSIPSMRDRWIATVVPPLATGLFAGVFADRANPLPQGNKPQPGPGQSAPNGYYSPATGACVSPPDGLPPFRYSRSAFGDNFISFNNISNSLRYL